MKRTAIKIASKKKKSDKIFKSFFRKLKQYGKKIRNYNLNINNNYNKLKTIEGRGKNGIIEDKRQPTSNDSKNKLQKTKKKISSDKTESETSQKTTDTKPPSTEKIETDGNFKERSLMNKFLKQVEARTGVKTSLSGSQGRSDSCISQSVEINVPDDTDVSCTFSCTNYLTGTPQVKKKINHNNSSVKEGASPKSASPGSKHYSSEEEKSAMDILSLVKKEDVLKYVEDFKKLQALNKSNHQSSYLTEDSYNSDAYSQDASSISKTYGNATTPVELPSTSKSAPKHIYDMNSIKSSSTYGDGYEEIINKVVSTKNALINLQKKLSSAKKSTKPKRTPRSSRASRNRSSRRRSSSKSDNECCYIPISPCHPCVDPFCTTSYVEGGCTTPCMDGYCTTSCVDGCCTASCMEGCCTNSCMDGYCTTSCCSPAYKPICNEDNTFHKQRREHSDDYDSIDSSSIITLSISNSSLASSVVSKKGSKRLSSGAKKKEKSPSFEKNTQTEPLPTKTEDESPADSKSKKAKKLNTETPTTKTGTTAQPTTATQTGTVTTKTSTGDGEDEVEDEENEDEVEEGEGEDEDVTVQVLTSSPTYPLPLSQSPPLKAKTKKATLTPTSLTLPPNAISYDDPSNNLISSFPFSNSTQLKSLIPMSVKSRTTMTPRLPFLQLPDTQKMDAKALKKLKDTINGYLNMQIKELTKKDRYSPDYSKRSSSKKVKKKGNKKIQLCKKVFETVDSSDVSRPFPELSSSSTKIFFKAKKNLFNLTKMDSATTSSSTSNVELQSSQPYFATYFDFNSFEDRSNKDTCNNNENASFPLVDHYSSPQNNTSFLNPPQQSYSLKTTTSPVFPCPSQMPPPKPTPQLNVTLPRSCLPPCSVACGPEPMCCPETCIFYEECPTHPYQRTLERMNQLRKTFKDEQNSDDCMGTNFVNVDKSEMFVSPTRKSSKAKSEKTEGGHSRKTSKGRSEKTEASRKNSKGKSDKLDTQHSRKPSKGKSEKLETQLSRKPSKGKSNKLDVRPSRRNSRRSDHRTETRSSKRKSDHRAETRSSRSKSTHNTAKMRPSQTNTKVLSEHSDMKSVPSTKVALKQRKSLRGHKPQHPADKNKNAPPNPTNPVMVGNDREFFNKMLDVFNKVLAKSETEKVDKCQDTRESFEKIERILGVLGKSNLVENNQFAFPANCVRPQTPLQPPQMYSQPPPLGKSPISNHNIFSIVKKFSVAKTNSSVKKQESIHEKSLPSKPNTPFSARQPEDVFNRTSLWKRFLCTEFCKPYRKGIFHKHAETLLPSDSSQTTLRQKFKVNKPQYVSENSCIFDESKLKKDRGKKINKHPKKSVTPKRRKKVLESNSCNDSSNAKTKEVSSFDKESSEKITRQKRKESKRKQKKNSKTKKKSNRKNKKVFNTQTLSSESQTIKTSQNESKTEEKSSEFSRKKTTSKKKKRNFCAKLKVPRKNMPNKSYKSDISAQTSFCIMKALNVQKNFKKEMKKTEELLKKVMLKKGMHYENLSKNSSWETISKSQIKSPNVEKTKEKKNQNEVQNEITPELTLKVDALIQSRLNDELKNLKKNTKVLQTSSTPATSDFVYSHLTSEYKSPSIDHKATSIDQNPAHTVYRVLEPRVYPNPYMDAYRMPSRHRASVDPMPQPVEAATQTEKERKRSKSYERKPFEEKKKQNRNSKKSSETRRGRSKEAKSDYDSLEKDTTITNKDSSEILITIKNKNLSEKKSKHEKILEELLDSLKKKNKRKKAKQKMKDYRSSRISLYSLYEHKKRLEEEMLNVDLNLRRLHTAPYDHTFKTSPSRRCVSAFDEVTDSCLEKSPFEYRNQSANNILLELMDDAEVIVVDDMDEIPEKRCGGVSFYSSNQAPRKGYNGTARRGFNGSLNNRYENSFTNTSKNNLKSVPANNKQQGFNSSVRKGFGNSLKRGTNFNNRKHSMIDPKTRSTTRRNFGLI